MSIELLKQILRHTYHLGMDVQNKIEHNTINFLDGGIYVTLSRYEPYLYYHIIFYFPFFNLIVLYYFYLYYFYKHIIHII